MTPEDMAKLISEMEGMPEAQKEQLKSMGMDPDTSEYYQYRLSKFTNEQDLT